MRGSHGSLFLDFDGYRESYSQGNCVLCTWSVYGSRCGSVCHAWSGGREGTSCIPLKAFTSASAGWVATTGLPAQPSTRSMTSPRWELFALLVVVCSMQFQTPSVMQMCMCIAHMCRCSSDIEVYSYLPAPLNLYKDVFINPLKIL